MYVCVFFVKINLRLLILWFILCQGQRSQRRIEELKETRLKNISAADWDFNAIVGPFVATIYSMYSCCIDQFEYSCYEGSGTTYFFIKFDSGANCRSITLSPPITVLVSDFKKIILLL